MGKITGLFSKLIDNIRNSIKRFPESAFLSLIMVGLIIYIVHGDFGEQKSMDLSRILMVIILGLPLSAMMVLISERLKFDNLRRYLSFAVVLLFIAGYYYVLPDRLGSEAIIKYLVLCLASFLTFVLVPYFIKREKFSLYVVEIMFQFFTTLIFSMVLYSGLSAIFATTNMLFVLDMSEKIFMDLFAATAGLFAIPYFLGHIPEIEEEFDEKYYPPGLRILLNFIVIPLLSVYTLILYAYLVRILVLGELPVNLLGHLVVWYSIISVVVLFFVRRIQDTSRYTKMFYKYYPLAILVPLAMLFVAIGSRISDFGFTPSRVFVVYSGVWALLSMLYIKFFKNHKSTVPLIMAIVTLLLVSHGPISAFNLSFNQQIDRFINLLEDNGLYANGEVVSNPDVSDDVKDEVNEYLRYFQSNHSFERVEFIPDDFDMYSDAKGLFGFSYSYDYERPVGADEVYYDFYRPQLVYPIEGYDYAAMLEFYSKGKVEEPEITSDVEIDIDSDKNILTVIYMGESVMEIDLASEVEKYDSVMNGKNPETAEEATFEVVEGSYKALFVFRHLYYEKDENRLEFSGELYLDVK